MFELTLGLRDNPFNPLFRDQPVGELRNLGGRPLPMELATQHPVLQALFCSKLKAVAENESRAHGVLFGSEKAPGEAGTPPSRKRQVLVPVILLITGNKGAGKTTFASFLRQLVLTATPPGMSTDLIAPTPWTPFAKEFAPCVGQNLDPFEKDITELETSVLSQIGPNNGSPLITLDNVPKGRFARVAEFHEKLDRHFAVFIVTTDDPSLQQPELDWYPSKTRLFNMPNITAEELRPYIETRVSHFRSPKRPEFDRVSPLFPFARTYAGAAERPPQPLRLLNKQLERLIEERHQQLEKSGPDVTTCPEQDLLKVLIV